MALLTVFTPTYNRAYTLNGLYESLLAQDSRNFEWLVVDDGSTDNTAELIKQWQGCNNGFVIRYIYKDNGGMHTAHNFAYENITSELSMCIDSDDFLTNGAVRKILDKWSEVKYKGYAGIIGLDSDASGKLIGTGFEKGITHTTLSAYYGKGGRGDKKLVYSTEIIKKYLPYPVFDDEKYISLAYIYRLIDQDYELAVIDDVLCVVNSYVDGHSKGIWKEYLRSPKGFVEWRKLCLKHPESRKRLIIDCIHYVAESLVCHNNNLISQSPRKLLTALAIPAGWLLSLYIKVKNCRK